MSGFLQVTLHPTRKAVQDERTADNGNPEHTGRKIFAFHFEHDTFIQTEMGDLLMNNIHMKQLEQTLTSMEVSEMVGKEHGKLLKDIRRYTSQIAQANIAWATRAKLRWLISFEKIHIKMLTTKADLAMTSRRKDANLSRTS